MLRVINVKKDFYSFRYIFKALRGVSFSLYPGEFLGIVGQSGAGKTTLVRILLGLLQPSEGEVQFHINGYWKPLQHLRKCDWRVFHHHVQWVPQDAEDTLDPETSIHSSLLEAYKIQYPSVSSSLRNHLIYCLCQELGISEEKMCLFPEELSGGEKERIVFARALAALGYGCNKSDPRLLITDEPTSGLDAVLLSRIGSLLKSVRDMFPLAAVIVTHNINFLKNLADRVLVFYRGWIIEEGPCEDVLSQGGLHHPFTSQLLGSLYPDFKIIEENIYNDAGCPFYYPCHLVEKNIVCRDSIPILEGTGSHKIACWQRKY